MQNIEERIFNFLKESGVNYDVFEHEPVYTCDKMAKILRIQQNFIAKSLIVKKDGGSLTLVVLPGEMKIDYT